MLNCVVMFVGALAFMTSIDWRLALALACVTPFLFIFTHQFSTKAKPLFLAIRNSLASMNSMVEENIEGNRVVKAFVREDYETGKFDEHNDDYMDRNMAMAMNTRKYLPRLDWLGFALQLITLGFGGFLVARGAMSLGGLVVFVDDRRPGAPVRLARQRLAALQRELCEHSQTPHRHAACEEHEGRA